MQYAQREGTLRKEVWLKLDHYCSSRLHGYLLMSGEIWPIEVERGDHRYIQYIVANGHSDARASLCTSGRGGGKVAWG